MACGFGTAYQALCRAEVSGLDAVLVTGIGPVGMAVGLLAGKMGAGMRIGVDVAPERLELALGLGAIDHGVVADEHASDRIRELSGGLGCEVSVDCSGSPVARMTALEGTRRFGRCVFVGEGNRLDVDVSQMLIHTQLTVHGSWVTSVWRMEELVEQLVRWDLRPEQTVTHRFPLDDADAAYKVADEGLSGKVALVMEDGAG